MYKTFLSCIICLTIILFSCSKEAVDDIKPQIDLTIPDAAPVNCDTLYFGENFTMKLRMTDNVELGSFSVELHNNFDHHSHSTEVTQCTLSAKRDPDNPFRFIQDYEIPPGKKEHVTDLQISIPASNNDGDFDEGDYHFFISLTDAEGWSAQKGLNIKMLYR